MDNRITLKVNESFLEILQFCFQKGEKVSLLIDENGVERKEGFINAVDEEDSDTSIVLNDESKIELKNIVAVNGVFRPEYGEC